MSHDNDNAFQDTEYAHRRLNKHDKRLTMLERWKERVMGALVTLAFIIGSAGIGGAVLNYIL